MKRLLLPFCACLTIASLLGFGAIRQQHNTQSFGVVSGLPDPTLPTRPASIVGVNVALEQYDDLTPVLDQLAGIPWLRQTFAWDSIEPQPGAYAWARWDKLVEASAARGHKLIAVLGRSPAWARTAGAPASAPPSSPEAFAGFAGALAQRYSGVIDVYQIWDEPNLSAGWGDRAPSAAGYAGLLQAGYQAVHGADPNATVIAAALAPTVEIGPENMSDLLYLQQLYDLGAGAYFDAAAGKPYGFYTGPDDRLVDPSVLNFSRFALLRQVMVRNGDAHKLLWAGNLGWNTLVSPWGRATLAQQSEFTLAALERARVEWPWAGVMAIENFQPALPAGDPRWGFALLGADGQASELLNSLNRTTQPQPAASGNYAPNHPAASYSGAWKFSPLGADIPEDYQQAAMLFSFEGTDLGLTVRRGDYRGYLYVEIDGQPANHLPRDERGAYLVLTSPNLDPEVVTVLVASGLAPDGSHLAVLNPDRGWGQWALVGFAVGRRVDESGLRYWSALLILAALLGAGGAAYFGRQAPWERTLARIRPAWERLGARGQLLLAAGASALLYWTSWITWGNDLVALSRRSGDGLPLALTALTAGLFYYSPSLLLALLSLAALLALFYLRLDLGLALTAFFIPFYLQYRLLWQRGFAMVEVCTLLLVAALLLRGLRPSLARLGLDGAHGRSRAWWRNLSGADWAVSAYLVVATASFLVAQEKPVALREYRLVMLEPVLFYAVMRACRLDRRGLWRIIDFFVLGAVVVALYGLYQYATGTDLITAEDGLARIRSVYGSPNNLALYLGRALPVAFAVAAIGRDRWRRRAYGPAAALLGATAVLTFSKGALLLGVPAGVAVVVIGWLGRAGLLLVAGAVGLGLAALPLVARVPRFGGLIDFRSGTSFFRLKLWLSAWRMFLDHPWLGVGPDNFLYQYRSRYILPEAWQEPNLSHPHNVVLDFLSRLGLLGLAAGLWLQLAFWTQALRNFRRLSVAPHGEALAATIERRGLLALTVGLMGLVADMLAHGLVDHSFFLVDLAYAFFLALAASQHVDGLSAAAAEPIRVSTSRSDPQAVEVPLAP